MSTACQFLLYLEITLKSVQDDTFLNFNLCKIYHFNQNNPEPHCKLCLKSELISMACKSFIHSISRFLWSIRFCTRPIDKNLTLPFSLRDTRT